MNDYKPFYLHYWPGFSSTSKSREFAMKRSRGKDSSERALIFEIYTNQNTPVTNIDLPRNWSFYPSEEEVLLLPFFCFQVV
jgi:hypothetical protein